MPKADVDRALVAAIRSRFRAAIEAGCAQEDAVRYANQGGEMPPPAQAPVDDPVVAPAMTSAEPNQSPGQADDSNIGLLTEDDDKVAGDTGGETAPDPAIDTHPFAGVVIPENWKEPGAITWPDLRKLASDICDAPVINKDDAVRAIEAELSRREAFKAARGKAGASV